MTSSKCMGQCHYNSLPGNESQGQRSKVLVRRDDNAWTQSVWPQPLPAKCNNRHTAPTTKSVQNCLWQLLTSSLNIAMQLLATIVCCFIFHTVTIHVAQFKHYVSHHYYYTHTHLMALCLRLPGWAGTRKVKPIWILLKEETVSRSGISWAICKSTPRSRQITTPAPHHSRK